MKKALVLCVIVFALLNAAAFAAGGSERVAPEETAAGDEVAAPADISAPGDTAAVGGEEDAAAAETPKIIVRIQNESGQVYQYELSAADFAGLSMFLGYQLILSGSESGSGSLGIDVQGSTPEGFSFEFHQSSGSSGDDAD